MYALDRTRDAIFIERLHAKSLARGLEWTPTEHEGRYQVTIGEFTVEIGEGGDTGVEPEILIIRGGKALEILTPDLLPEPTQPGAISRRQAFGETYEAARRIGLGVDRAIESLIQSLL